MKFYNLLGFGCLAFASVAPAVAQTGDAGEGTRIYASVYSTNSWKEENFDEVGLYSFPVDEYSRTIVMQDPDIDASGGGVLTEDFYFCTQEYNYGSWTDVTHYIIDPDTWTTVSSLRDGDANAVATDMTYDYQTAKIYGCFSNGSSYVFGTLNEATGERSRISDIDTPWIACSVDGNGNLYAVDMEGKLLSVDKVRGVFTELGDLGFKATRRSTGAIDSKTGIFYVVVTNSVENPDPYAYYELNESKLYAVDIKKVEARLVYTFEDGEAMGGMFIPGPVAPDGAPAEVTDFVVDFVAGSMTGTVSFTIPETSFGGKPMEGEVSYLVRANGSLFTEGKAQCGEKVTASVKISEAGKFDVVLQLSNAAGRGPKTKTTLWLGPDTPKPVTDVKLSWADNSFTLTWNAADGSVNGGYFDPAKVTYNIIRQPGDITVAEGVTGTEFSETMDVPAGITAYHYDVVQVYDGTPLPAVSSNTWRLGSMPLPYSAKFDADDAMDLFTVIDVDGDKLEWYREWEFYIETTDELIPAAVYPYSSSYDADDWLVTPPFHLTEGGKYAFSYTSLTDYEGAEPMLEIFCGSAPEAEAMTQCVMQPVGITSLLPEKHTVEFTAEATGIYYIGMHACSEPDRSGIAITEIGLEQTGASAIESVDAAVEASDASYSVYTVDGRKVASGKDFTASALNLPSGIYIVKTGDKTFKTTVR